MGILDKVIAKPLGRIVVGGIVAGVTGEVARPFLEGLGVLPRSTPDVGRVNTRDANTIAQAAGKGIRAIFAPTTLATDMLPSLASPAFAPAAPAAAPAQSSAARALQCSCVGGHTPCDGGCGNAHGNGDVGDVGAFGFPGGNVSSRRQREKAEREKLRAEVASMKASEQQRLADERLAKIEQGYTDKIAASEGRIRAELEARVRSVRRARVQITRYPAKAAEVATSPNAELIAALEKLATSKEGATPSAVPPPWVPPPWGMPWGMPGMMPGMMPQGPTYAPQGPTYAPQGPGYDYAPQGPTYAPQGGDDMNALADEYAASIAGVSDELEGAEGDELEGLDFGDGLEGAEGDELEGAEGDGLEGAEGDELEGLDFGDGLEGAEGDELEGAEGDELEGLDFGDGLEGAEGDELEGAEVGAACGSCSA